MHSLRRTNVLIVADQTADSPELLDAVARRARGRRCSFTLLVPRRAHRPGQIIDLDDHGADQAFARLDAAVPLLSAAAGHPIVGMIGSHEPLATIKDALNLLSFDEVIISMLPAQPSRGLYLDLPRQVRELGVPVTEVLGAGTRATSLPPAHG